MESLVYLQLCCLHESSPPTTTIPSPLASKSAILLATALLLAGGGGVEKTYAQSLWDSGDEVQRVQFRLQALGYDTVQATGLYDLNTQAAVMDFQRKYNLEADGIVGRATRPILFGNELENSFWNNSVSNSSPPSAFSFPPEGANVTSTLPQFPEPFRDEAIAPSGEFARDRSFLVSQVFQEGDRGESVRRIQQKLRDFGYYYGSIDGIYGGNLKNAVERFQAERFLQVDGKVGPETLAALGLPYTGGVDARGYVVAIPGNNDVLYQVQRFVTGARLQGSRRGDFVNAGQFNNRHDAESLAYRLRAQGFDARVAYNP